MTLPATPHFDVQRVVDGLDGLAVQRPTAARVIAVAASEDSDAKELADSLSGDVALSGRVMKLANSAYYGMRGRVTSLQMAVSVVGFTTVQTIATVALTDLSDESRLPDDFWNVSTQLAVASSRLASRFGERPADAMCLGALAQLGSALLYHHDRDDYSKILESESTYIGRRREERNRYGVTSVEITAMALEAWGFPSPMLVPLRRLDDRTSPSGGLLRAGYEIVSRLTIRDYQVAPIGPLTSFKVREEDLPEILFDVRDQAEDLRQLMIG
jgi:HD-like signal output (HDOD) protein